MTSNAKHKSEDRDFLKLMGQRREQSIPDRLIEAAMRAVRGGIAEYVDNEIHLTRRGENLAQNEGRQGHEQEAAGM